MSSPAKQTACIDDLPPEMISKLFEYLPPKDLAACSMVNKLWHSIYAAFKLHRLAVVVDYTRGLGLIPSPSLNRPIPEAERCGPAMFFRLVEKPLLSNLKHLTLYGDDIEFDLNKLNRFRRLVHLEINIPLDGKVHLNLPRLRVLAFPEWKETCHLSIDCPELSTLLYRSEDVKRLNVKHPETIRKLETNMVDPKWLAPFKCVECLVTRNFRAISRATLLSLPALRELHYNENIEMLVRYSLGNEVGKIDRMKRTLGEFLGEAKKLRGRDFRFAFAGLQLTNVNVDQIDFGAQVDELGEIRREWVSNEYVHMKNYHLIEPGALHFVQRVDYTRLLSCVTGEFPRCFSQKFTGIDWLQVNGVIEDAAHLLWFLKSLRFLRGLVLVDSVFSQEFYDQLPAVAHSLICLNLEGDWKNELHLKFDFVSKFPHLAQLIIHQALSLESLASVLRSSAKLEDPFFGVLQKENRRLWVYKKRGSTVWTITEPGSKPRSKPFESENPGEIVSFLAGFRAALKTGQSSD